MSDKPRSPIRALARRTLDTATRSLPQPIADALRTGRALLRAEDRALLTTLATRLGDLSDIAASRLLSMDEAAAQLAVLMEDLTGERQGDDVAWQLLRHSPLLDGTFIGLLEPLMRKRDEPGSTPPDPTLIRSGRRAILRTLLALAPGESPVDGADDDLVDHLATRTSLDTLPLLDAALRGELPDEEEAHFVMMSYTIFLQSWLLRHIGHSAIGALLPGTTDGDVTPRLASDDESGS